MKLSRAICIGALILLVGCSRFNLATLNQAKQADFDKKLTCANAAEQALKIHGDLWTITEKTYVQEAFYSPKRNSCVAVFVLTTGDVTPLPAGGLHDTLSDTYEIVDTLTYQTIVLTSSGTGPDRMKTMDDINKEVSDLKEQ
jgi:hypothetical protein